MFTKTRYFIVFFEEFELKVRNENVNANKKQSITVINIHFQEKNCEILKKLFFLKKYIFFK